MWVPCGLIHLAYIVVLEVIDEDSKLYLVVNDEFVYQPSKMYPSFVGGGAGNDAELPWVTCCDATEVPPLELNVTVYVIGDHSAYSVRL